jgi:hypothetical protein
MHMGSEIPLNVDDAGARMSIFIKITQLVMHLKNL